MSKIYFLLLSIIFSLVSFGQTNNHSINFIKVNSGVNFGNSKDFDMESTKTICFWAKDVSNRSVRRSFLYKGNCPSSNCTDLHIWVNDERSPTITFTTGDDKGVCAAKNINFKIDSAWHFYSFVFILNNNSTGVKKFYLDGILYDSCEFTDNASPNSYDLLAGEYNGQNGNSFASVDFMDDISIWNSALSSSEISRLMICPPNGKEKELISFWNFEEGNGVIINDVTGKGHDGVITNDAGWSIDVPTYNCDNLNIDKLNRNNLVTVFPIPFDNDFNIKISPLLIGKSYRLFDLKGKLIKSGTLDKEINKIHLNDIPKGAFYLSIDNLNKPLKVIH